MSDIAIIEDGSVTVDGDKIEKVFNVELIFSVRRKHVAKISRYKTDDQGNILGSDSGPLIITEQYIVDSLVVR